MALKSATDYFRKCFRKDKLTMNMNTAPDANHIIARGKARINRLGIAISEEGRKAKPNKKRMTTLAEEKANLVEDLKALIAIKD